MANADNPGMVSFGSGEYERIDYFMQVRHGFESKAGMNIYEKADYFALSDAMDDMNSKRLGRHIANDLARIMSKAMRG